jgi:ABC-type transporter Mla subunit MlaD
MVGQLPADHRMSRRALGAGLFAALFAVTVGGAWAWWRAWSEPRVSVVFRPTFSVEGISTGTPVRVNGVVVGQVESIGLKPDLEGRLRPEVNPVSYTHLRAHET